MADSRSNKRPRVDLDESSPDSPESPETKRLRENILDILDDEDAPDRDPATQDLASFMKSFEEEIGLSSSDSLHPPSQESEVGESLPDLGFLLGASDDELGLPPTSSSGEENEKDEEDILRGPSETVGFDQMWGFEDEIPCYDVLGYGIRSEEKHEEDSVVLGGLFDFSDAVSGPPSEFSEFPWRPESLPAL
ncbi:hypothetical protein MRB53_018566 [Persea americana]|uniref:Uncharacterized protein n=1 Tax=Persea americana TaxID=3435 RepID=A0ACC2M8A7_PERAE|nr:hypothetical protein MRB53_018566 [Persea americana]